MRYFNAFPINDVGLHSAIKLAGSLDWIASIDEMKQIAPAWEEYVLRNVLSMEISILKFVFFTIELTKNTVPKGSFSYKKPV